MLEYLTTAAILGVGWFGIMIASPFTRFWFLEQPAQNLGCMVVASVLVAVVCRRFIASAHTRKGHLLRAIVLPYFGAIMHLAIWTALFGYVSFDEPELQSVADIPAVITVPLLAVTGTALSCFVVIPYGYLAQYLLAKKARSLVHTAVVE